MKKTILPLLVLLVFSFVLAACGGGQGGASGSINVTMTDFQYTPNSFTVPAGQEVKLTIKNSGAVEHSFVIMKLGSEVTSSFSDKDQANVYWEEAAVPAGQTVTDTFTAPGEPGTYQIVCAVPGHFEAGMTAKLVVVSGE